MSATTTTNGRPKKQLSDQLDRLDSIIDVLAEGLPGAVAEACREGARAAVKDAIIEIISNPELRALIAPPTPVPSLSVPATPNDLPPEAKPGLWSAIRSKLAAARDAVAARCHAARDAVAALGKAAGEAVPVRRVVLVTLGVGVAVAAVSLVAPTGLSAVATGVGAACVAAAVQVGGWFRAAGRRLGLVT